MKVHILPTLNAAESDPGNGGIGRVIRGQKATLPAFGWEVTDNPAEADVIHCHVEIPATYLRLYPDIPFITSNHGFYWTGENYNWEQWCYQVNQRAMAAIRASDAVVAVSDWVAQSIRRNTMRDVRVIYHGIDLAEWTVPDTHAAYVLWNKTRVDPICDTAPMNGVAALLPRVHFVSTFGLPAQNIELTGRMPYEQQKEIVRHAGVYLATTRETFGIGTLEALAAGVPVVGYAFGGQVEIIEHGVDGWLVRPGDTEGLAEGIQWALAHRDEISPRARAKAEQFPVERSGEQYARLYDEVLARHRAEHAPDRPRVSVIVPAYKMGDYLDATLRSVAAQDSDDWECIVVNDASPDPRDHEITQRYVAADSRFREIVHARNGYLAAARNTGIAAARGRYIFPLDADDQMLPHTLRVLADALDHDRSLHIAYGGVFFTQADGQTPMIYQEARARGLGPGHSGWPISFNLEWMLRGPGQLLPYASMFRRTVWEQTGGYRTRSRSSEDQDFWLRATSYGFTAQMVTEADTLLYRVRPDSMSSAKGEGWEDHRGWFPWCAQANRALVPGGAVQEQKPLDALPLPAYDPAPIAVIIPVGPGHGQYVIDAVDSVDAQTFRNWECIVVNDSGADLPPLPSWVRIICADAACPCIDGDPCHYRAHAGSPAMRWPDPRGAAAARNRGVRASRSSMFLPLDADDYLQPNALALMWENAIGDTRPAVIYSDFWEDPHAEGTFTAYETPDYDAWHLIRRGAIHAVTALTPRRFWEEVGGYDETLAWEDWAFSIAIAAKGYCSRRIAIPLFTYRKHTGMRRNANFAEFEASKAAIMQKDFGLTKGGELLACSSCPSGRATTMGFSPLQQSGGLPAAGSSVPQDAVLIAYTGPREGTFRMRSGVNPAISYAFSRHRPEGYVHKADAEALLARVDFMLVDTSQRETRQEMVAAAPPLVAARTPEMVGAVAAPSGAGPGESAWSPEAVHGFPAGATPPTPPEPMEPAASTASAPVAVAERPVSPMVQSLADGNTREALNKMAADLGVEGIEALRSNVEVAQIITIRREMMAS